MLTITLDWLSVTFKEHTHEAESFMRTYASFPDTQDTKARFGYGQAIVDGNGAITMWDTDFQSMGHHVIFAGSVLRNLFERNGIQPDALLRACLNAGGSVTRLDLAEDLKDTAVDLSAVYQSLEQGNNRGTARTFGQIRSNDNGHTIYVGSRQSERFIRIYDKAAQAGMPGVVWTRLEVETKGMVARSLAHLLVSTRSWSAVFTGIVGTMLNLGSVGNIQAFLSSEDVPIGIPKLERTTDREKWIAEQVIPAVARHYIDNPTSEAVTRLLETLNLIDRQRKE